MTATEEHCEALPLPDTNRHGKPVAQGVTWLLWPHKIGASWLVGTTLIWFGLLRDEYSPPTVLATLAVALGGVAIFGLGFRLRAKRVLPRPEHINDQSIGISLSKTLLAMLGAVAWTVETVLHMRGVTSYIGTFDDFSAARGYAARQAAIASGLPSSGLATLSMGLGIFALALVPILLLEKSRIPAIVRHLGWAAVVANGLGWAISGTLKGIADIVLLVVASMLVRRARRIHSDRTSSPQSGRARFSIIAWVVVITLPLFVIASLVLGNRIESQANREVPGVELRLEPILGDSAAVGVAAFLQYVGQGYEGLAANLTQPFVWTYGLGASPGLASLVEVFTGVSIDSSLTYPERTEYYQGYSAYGKWSSSYPWLASDLTFAGAVIAMGAVGYGLASSWIASVALKRFSSVLWFSFALTVVAYIPLNNQSFASTRTVVTIAILSLFSIVSAVLPSRKSRAALEP